MRNMISEIKNKLEGVTSRMEEVKDQISELEDKVERNTQVEQQHEKRVKNYNESLRKVYGNMTYNNIRIKGIPEGEEKNEGVENFIEKIMTENFPN